MFSALGASVATSKPAICGPQNKYSSHGRLPSNWPSRPFRPISFFRFLTACVHCDITHLMKRLAVVLFIMACASLPAMGQDKVDGFVARVYQQEGQTMPYRLFIPEKYKKSRK